MAKQVYFVVAVDLDECVPFIDDDTFTARFSSTEQVWDTELQEWQEDPDQEFYDKALKILNTIPLAKD
jgi:hypothetical protein